MKEVWPAILVTGVTFAVPQFVISNYINPWIVDIGASLISMGGLILFLKVWQPKKLWLSPVLRGNDESVATMAPVKPLDKTPLTQAELWSALLPWIIVCIVMLIWGQQRVQTLGELDLHLELSDPRTAQHDQLGGAGGGEADAARRGVRIHLSVVHRHGAC